MLASRPEEKDNLLEDFVIQVAVRVNHLQQAGKPKPVEAELSEDESNGNDRTRARDVHCVSRTGPWAVSVMERQDPGCDGTTLVGCDVDPGH